MRIFALIVLALVVWCKPALARSKRHHRFHHIRCHHKHHLPVPTKGFQYAWSGANQIEPNACAPYTIARTSDNRLRQWLAPAREVDIETSLGTFYSDSKCVKAVDDVDFGFGNISKKFYFKSKKAGRADFRAYVDRKKIVATYTVNVGRTTAPNPSGTLDVTFGNGGVKVGEEGFNGLNAAKQSDGKVVVVGYRVNEDLGWDIALTRYNLDGSVDTTFGDNGLVISDLGSDNDFATRVVIQTDGKIVVAGYADPVAYTVFAVQRFLPNGQPDLSFAGNSLALTPLGSGNGFAHALLIQPDGKILAAGSFYDAEVHYALVRYLADGTLDSSFNGSGYNLTTAAADEVDIQSLQLGADGSVFTIGQWEAPGSDIAIGHYSADGILDSAFGDQGFRLIDHDGDDLVVGSFWQNGKMLIVGNTGSDQLDFLTMRLTPTGDLDPSWGGAGIVRTNVGTEENIAAAGFIDSAGRLVVVGSIRTSGNQDFALVRYLGNGALDVSFNQTGIVTTEVGTHYDNPLYVGDQPGGKIFVLGFSPASQSSLMARYWE